MYTSKKIKQARPNLSFIAPLTHFIVTCFVFFNAIVALAIYLQRNSLHLAVFTTYTNAYFWSGIFLLLSAAMAYASMRNDWKLVRHALIAGLLVKMFFLYALIILAFQTGWSNALGTINLWVFATLIQAGTVIHFIPIPGDNDVK